MFQFHQNLELVSIFLELWCGMSAMLNIANFRQRSKTRFSK